MPLYEYKCGKCENVSEFFMKMADPHPDQCPSCGGGPLSKLMSQTAFQLKGGGWYTDRYDGKSNKKPASDGGSESKSESPAATSTTSSDSGAPTKSQPAKVTSSE